jgi:osmotically-inducible protein OsmY
MISQSRKDRNGRDRSDDLTEAAKNRLQESPYWGVRSLSCDCRRGILFLRGHLPTFYQKQLAQEAVAKLAGVLHVMNETVVDTPVVVRRV